MPDPIDTPAADPARSLEPEGDAGASYASTRARAIEGGSLLFVRYVVFGVLSLGGSTFLIRTLGAEDWATYSVAYFVAIFLSDFFGANALGGLINRLEAPGERVREAAVAMMVVVGLGCAVVVAAASVPAAALYGDPRLTTCLLGVAACALVFAARAPSVALLERRLDYRWIAAGDLLDQLTFFAVAIPLVLSGAGLTGVAIALAARGIVSTVVLRRRSPVPLLGRWHGDEVRRLVGFTIPTLGTAGLVLVHGLIPVIVLGSDNALALAFMVASATIVGYAGSVHSIVQRVGFPGLATLQRDPTASSGVLQRTLALLNVVMTSLVVPLAALCPLFLPALFGARWDEAAPVFVAVSAAVILSATIVLGNAVLNAFDAPRDVLRLQIVMTGCYLLAALGLAFVSPLLAAPLAYALSRVVGASVAVGLMAARGVRLHLRSSLLIQVGAVLMMSGLSALTSARPAAGVGATLAVAAAWLWVQRREVSNLWEMVRSRRAAVAA